MATFARIDNNRVVEIISLPDDVSVADAFHPVVAETLRPTSSNVQPGWRLVNGQFQPPAAEPAAPVRRLDFLSFLDLFTAEEKAGVIDSQDTQVKLFLLMAAGASMISLDDPRTAEGLDSLVAQNLLTPERKTEILSVQQPSAPAPMAAKKKQRRNLQ